MLERKLNIFCKWLVRKLIVLTKINFRLLLILILCLSINKMQAQPDFDWWNKKHNWDNITHWTQYLIISPAYMGPNSLPVAKLYPATIPRKQYIEFGTEGHYNPGDKTANLYLNYNLPLFSDRASLEINYRPIEIYKTDTITRDLRRSREKDGTGYSLGDVYIGTFVQLVENHSYLPDLMLSVNIKTTSGTNIDGARHTDTPGYWFDATLGKSFSTNNNYLKNIRLYGRIGFYSYQTFIRNNYQNDALLHGAGLNLQFDKFSVSQQFTGYIGYFNNGDQPLQYRLIFNSNRTEKINYRLLFQQGIKDYPFTTIRLTMIWQFMSVHEVQ